MSRIGRQPIQIPAGVDVTIAGREISVKGPKGTLSRVLNPDVRVTKQDSTIVVERLSEAKPHRQLHGLTRTLVNNMVIGVTQGYSKTLEVVGTGYRVQAKGAGLELALGFSHPVSFPAPDGISFTVETPTRFQVSGIDKQLVGEVAANIRKLRAPEPYKGKGVKYAGEYILRKEGKKK